jgi:hypothetical protein
VLLALILIAMVLSVISQGGLADSVAAIDRGEERRFGSTFRAGLGTFWRVLGLVVVLTLIALGLLLAIGAPAGLAIFGAVQGFDSLGARLGVIIPVAIVGIAALIVVFFAFSIIGQYALRELVLRRERIVASIGAGYRLFRGRLGASLLVGLLQIAISLAIGIALVLVVILLGLILASPVVALALYGYTTAAVIVGILAGLLFIAPLLVISGAVGTFSHALWTLAYLRLRMPSGPPGMAPPAMPPPAVP